MATKTSSAETTLSISKTLAAPRERVFNAWTDPKELMRWFGPSEEFTTPIAEIDLRVGGKYRIQMKGPDGEAHTAIGTYREIVAPEKLVFTWSWEGGSGCGGSEPIEVGETLVTVVLQDRGSSTELMLTHELFPDVEARDKHNQGWSGCLERLAKVV